jgi:hypothetical protein
MENPNNPEGNLEEAFDDILYQLSKGNTIERLSRGVRWENFQQVNEWKNRFGFQFHIYSNDHLIENKPHFHLRKQSAGIDCRFSSLGNYMTAKREWIKKLSQHWTIYYHSQRNKKD